MWKYEHKQDKKKLGVDSQIRAAKPHARAYKRACWFACGRWFTQDCIVIGNNMQKRSGPHNLTEDFHQREYGTATHDCTLTTVTRPVQCDRSSVSSLRWCFKQFQDVYQQSHLWPPAWPASSNWFMCIFSTHAARNARTYIFIEPNTINGLCVLFFPEWWSR